MATKDQEAVLLAGMHYRIETGLTQVYRVNGPVDVEIRPNEPIKLLEVNENTVSSGIMPIQFGPSPAAGLNYSSIIIEVTPDEFRQIQDRRLELPHGWKLGDPIPRPAEPQG
jgi:hypothetical protein